MRHTRTLIIALAGLLGLATASAPASAQVTDPTIKAADEATTRWAENYGVFRSTDHVRAEIYGAELPTSVVYTSDLTSVGNRAVEDPRTGTRTIEGNFEMRADRPFVSNYASPGSAWVNVGNACQSRKQNSTGYIDTCYQILRQNADNDSSSKYYAFKHYGTAKSTGVFTLTHAYVKSSRSSASTGSWSWVDWDPRSDQNHGSCGDLTIGVAFIAEVSYTANACGMWDMQKGTAAGTFQNYWRGQAWRQEREIAYMTLIKTSNSGNPKWSFSGGFGAGTG